MHVTTDAAADERMRFVIFEDNGGRFHWRLLDEGGTSMALSAAAFDTADDARLAAADVRRYAAGGVSP